MRLVARGDLHPRFVLRVGEGVELTGVGKRSVIESDCE